MLHEIKIDLEDSIIIRNRRRCETGGRDVERHVPAMIDPWTLRETNLADDLRPQLQCRESLAPCLEGKARPRFLMRTVANAHQLRPGRPSFGCRRSPCW